jgi:hypothetical protein
MRKERWWARHRPAHSRDPLAFAYPTITEIWQQIVIAPLDRMTQYSAAIVTNRIGRGVLDHPLSRVMTSQQDHRLMRQALFAPIERDYIVAWWHPSKQSGHQLEHHPLRPVGLGRAAHHRHHLS